MANTTQREFDETLAAIAGATDRFQGSAADAASTMANAVAGTYSLGEIVARNAEGAALGALSSAGGGSVAGEIVSRATEGLTTGVLASSIRATQGGGSVAGTILKSAFGLVPLIGGLFGLFGGDEPAEPEPLVRYALPAALEIEAAATASGLEAMDYDQFGRPRALSGPSAPAGSRDLPAQITINVQALDARSLMDRSSDIAAAVRHAMLNLNSINDVVTDL